MKIIIISPHPGFGGASTANQNIAKSLQLAGNHIIYMDEYYPSDKTTSLNIDIYPIHKNGIKKQIQTYRYLKSLKPDFIILGMPIIGVINLIILTFFRIHGVKIGCIFHSLSLSKSLKGKIVDFLISCFSLICSHLFFVSQYTLASWNKFWFIKSKRKSSFVIYNAIEKTKTKKHVINENIKIGFVGRFSEEKQPHIFCETAKSYDKCNNMFFIAFGDGPLLNDCKKYYNKYVDFYGYCNNQETIYDSIDILLLTSEFENCPMIILEAALQGIPTIAPNVGGIPEIITNGYNGELYDGYNINDIKEKLDNVIKNYASYSINTLKFIKSYTIEDIAKKWNNTLNK